MSNKQECAVKLPIRLVTQEIFEQTESVNVSAMSTLQTAFDPFTEVSSLFHSTTAVINKPLYVHWSKKIKKNTPR